MAKKTATSAKPKTYHHGDLRRALLNAALTLVGEQGVQGFTLREAARAADVSHNAPYRHFATRAQLLVALAVEGQQLLLQTLQSSIDGCASRRERLSKLGVAYLQFGCEHAAHFRVMYCNEVAANATEELTTAQSATFNFFEQEIQQGEVEGLFRAGQTGDYALVGWSAIHGATMLVLDGILQGTAVFANYEPADLARLVIESLLDGMIKQKAPAKSKRKD